MFSKLSLGEDKTYALQIYTDMALPNQLLVNVANNDHMELDCSLSAMQL